MVDSTPTQDRQSQARERLDAHNIPVKTMPEAQTNRPTVKKTDQTSSLVQALLDRIQRVKRKPSQTLSSLLSDYDLSQSSTLAAEISDDQTLCEAAVETAPLPTPNHEPETIPLPNLGIQTAVSAGDRYEDLLHLGSGGMGTVRRVRDRLLNRELAMKIIHHKLLENTNHVLRFIQEAQVVSQLQHPNILPVYDLGFLPSGDLFFTMAEIQGKELSHYIQTVHSSETKAASNDTKEKWNLHRLVSAVNDVCKAVAYAHEHGVVHRDLKPDNIMIGSFGEVLVVDWGLAKVVGDGDVTEQPVVTARSQSNALQTMVGTIYGTPAYLAPELATGEAAHPSAQSDIYALGAILYEVIRGCRPIQGTDVYDVLSKVVSGQISSFNTSDEYDIVHETSLDKEAGFLSVNGMPIPPVLVETCLKAMSKDPKDRYASASEMVKIIGGWLDGSRRREQAMLAVKTAESFEASITAAIQQAHTLRAQAQDARTRVEMWQSEHEKSELWHNEDQAQRLEAESQLLRVKQIQAYRAALAHKADLAEAHTALAQYYQSTHQAAEQDGQAMKAEQIKVVLREHIDALPNQNPLKSELIGYLDGTGLLNFDTRPPGASISLSKFELRQRRLVLGAPEQLNLSEIDGYPLPMGSYIIEAKVDGYHPLRHPVYNRRADHISGKNPEGEFISLPLLKMGTLGLNDCYIPAGWTWLGGDEQTPNSLPRTRVWLDGFVIQKFPVTHEDYLKFLNDRVRSNRVEDALNHVPREQSSSDEELGSMAYHQAESGIFSLPKNPERSICLPRQPVTMIQWRSARAYAEWLSEKTGLPWSLPMEFEWEKAARGVDGRFYPWGDLHDPSFSCMKDSHEGEVKMQRVDDFPNDVSVYGVRGTAGNTRDWCLDRFRDDGPPLQNSRLVMPSQEDLDDHGFKSTRGGSYGNSASRARSADRDWWFPDRSYIGRGFRLVWRLADRA